MAKTKKRKKNKNKDKNRFESVSPDALALRGQEYLNENNFSRAIETFKYLLKIEPRSEWRKLLAEAYRGRSRALSSKGMYREALAILDNLSAFCAEAGSVGDLTVSRLALMINSGQYEKAAMLWQKEADRLEKTEQAEIFQDLFAALVLSGETAVLEKFADDAPLVQQYPDARDALNAFCSGQDETLHKHLGKISFRSPYKHLRLVLKGLLVVDSDPEAANRFFEKISPKSPFLSLARPLIGFGRPGSRDLSFLSQMNRQELSLLAAFTGVEPDCPELLSGLHQAADNPKKQFELLSLKGRQIDPQTAKDLCLHLLPLIQTDIRMYEKTFGPVSEVDKFRLEALRHEQQHDPETALQYWKRLAGYLLEKPGTEDTALCLSLIYRHMAGLAENMDDGFDEYEDVEFDKVKQYLEKSLDHDPEDKGVYLKLIDRCRHNVKLKRKWIESALKIFPEDIDILLAATELALENRSFKKASRFAEKILRIDPINTRVRNMLFQAHMAHGRKSVNAGKFHLAVREFSLAEESQRNNTQKGAAVICRGMTQILMGDDKMGTALVAEGQQVIGSQLQALVITAIEACLLEMDWNRQKRIQHQLKKCNHIRPDREEIIRLVGLVKSYPTVAPEFVRELFSILKPVLKKAARLEFPDQEMRHLCDFFYQNRWEDLLFDFAGEASKRWPDLPVYTFYALYGKSGGNVAALDFREFQRLEHAADAAVKQDDPHVAKMINDFIGLLRIARRYGGYDPSDEEEDEDNDDTFAVPDAGLLDEVLEILGRMNRLNDKKDGPSPERRPVRKREKKPVVKTPVEKKEYDPTDNFKSRLPGEQMELF